MAENFARHDTLTAARAEYELGRHSDMHLHAAQCGQLERGDQLLVRQDPETAGGR